MAEDGSTLILTREVISRLIPPAAYFGAVHEAFRRLGAGEIAIAAIPRLPAVDGAFHIRSAVATTTPHRVAVKVNGNFPHNLARHGLPTIQGFIALLDAERGRVLALMDSMEITARRTAASSGVAARLLARSDSRRVALIGCGVQGRYHLDALAPLFPLRSVALFDTFAANAQQLAELATRQGFTATVSASIREATCDADIIVTSTPSRSALLDVDDVPSGCFVAAVGADSPGKQELSPALMRAARVVPDILAQAAVMGDLQHAFTAAVMQAQDIHAELADVVIGRRPGRTDDREVFVFDSTGSGITDLAAAELAYEAACRDASSLRVRLNA